LYLYCNNLLPGSVPEAIFKKPCLVQGFFCENEKVEVGSLGPKRTGPKAILVIRGIFQCGKYRIFIRFNKRDVIWGKSPGTCYIL